MKKLPTKYLGLPLSNKTLRKKDWIGIIDKVQRRIDGWQVKLLSKRDRLILVNSVLTNLPLYFFSIFKAPKWVVKKIEALRRDFFKKGGVGIPEGAHMVAWSCICWDKKKEVSR